MSFKPVPVVAGQPSTLNDEAGKEWLPLYTHACAFPPQIFREIMINLIRNPQINSTHLFRADISLEILSSDYTPGNYEISPHLAHFKDFTSQNIFVRTLIPRKPKVDKPMDQTCLLFERTLPTDEIQSLVIYLPHFSSPSDSPFYHPGVYGIAFLHTYDPATREAVISIEYSFFDTLPRSPKLERTAEHLLAAVYKHGQGKAAGYVKRVNHDVIIPQAAVQNTYAVLKEKYARPMIDAWVETTDPGKHVFEDLGIAAFLIELWKEMYQGHDFPGFVDIGCGNGLLVHILLEEGYKGWGFDARARKSWSIYGTKAQENLHELVLIPAIIQTSHQQVHSSIIDYNTTPSTLSEDQSKQTKIHSGLFPKGTFIISNHADELTPWTPILATISSSPFMMIPCCSHALSGARFRAPISKTAGVSKSAYASLVSWVSKIADECGWNIEVEMLRIPSTRNTALIGRSRTANAWLEADVEAEMKKLVQRYGGAEGWEENAMKLVVASTRSH